MSQAKQIKLLEEQLELERQLREVEANEMQKEWKLAQKSWQSLHRILIKENLIGTKYFCICNDCHINRFYCTDTSINLDPLNKNAFCDCWDAEYLPIELFGKLFPNAEPTPPTYDT